MCKDPPLSLPSCCGTVFGFPFETYLAWVTLLVAGQLQASSPASLERAILTAQFFINQKAGSVQ